ncbi:hypothetical protein [Streptomyces sp. NRRL B-24720]|uniref:hypothetical protein n=1 Tax=Streptomyces sp. NRRL B-24720 TaxID=1476876 RepID=UPI000A68C93B|nr:hypothetical protein [Streptomyces sp. NRRL B-24720]
MNPYEGLATGARAVGTRVRVWVEVAVTQAQSPAAADRAWAARLTAPAAKHSG